MSLDEDGLEVPSIETIRRANQIARRLDPMIGVSELRGVPDAHGGIVLERRCGNLFESIRVSADGTAERCVFDNGRLDLRQPWLSQ